MSVISYRLDLVVSLIDTTTGMVVEERGASFFKDDRPLMPEHREEGLYLFLNIGREDFTLHARITGYEDYHGTICYQKLNERQPFYTIYLIPKKSILIGEPVLSYEDRIPELEAMEAITLLRANCAASEYNARKQELTVFRTNGSRSMPDVHYGLLQGQKDTYTHIEVEKDISNDKVKLAMPLEEEFQANTPIYRVIFGQVNRDGTFILRVRDSASEIPVIIRYCQNKEWHSIRGEFHSLAMGVAEHANREKEGGSMRKP